MTLVLSCYIKYIPFVEKKILLDLSRGGLQESCTLKGTKASIVGTKANLMKRHLAHFSLSSSKERIHLPYHQSKNEFVVNNLPSNPS